MLSTAQNSQTPSFLQRQHQRLPSWNSQLQEALSSCSASSGSVSPGRSTSLTGGSSPDPFNRSTSPGSSRDFDKCGMNFHDVALDAELAMLQHAYASEAVSQLLCSTTSSNSSSNSSPESSPSRTSSQDSSSTQKTAQQAAHQNQTGNGQQQINSEPSALTQGTWNLMDRLKWAPSKIMRPAEDAWKSYLDNPLATAGLMQLQAQNHHDDSAQHAALGLLYDYYNGPRNVLQHNMHAHQMPLQNQHKQMNQNNIVPPVHNAQQLAQAQQQQHQLRTIKSEPADHVFGQKEAEASSDSDSDVKDGIKTEGPNAGLPEDYQGEYFEYAMEAPKSLKQKEGEPTMSYINKAQFYAISLREVGATPWKFRNSKVKTVVSVIFGDGKPEEEQLRHWKYWHGRQHTAKQRVIDIADYKESSMISDINEFSHNAISFTWDVNDIAKIFISVNCLSTDFSAQKGIKGLPLLLQIDTYTDMRRNAKPAHRATVQLKVFCDKGAERKIRDEERKALRKKGGSGGAQPKPQFQLPVQNPLGIVMPGQQANMMQPNSKRNEIVLFKASSDLSSSVTYFAPEMASRTEADYLAAGEIPPMDTETRKRLCDTDGNEIPQKIPRHDPNTVLLYVKSPEAECFDALMLSQSNLAGLTEAIVQKYKIRGDSISRIYKKSKKGVLVNMDDIIIRHYSNEDTFIITFEEKGGKTKIVLTEV